MTTVVCNGITFWRKVTEKGEIWNPAIAGTAYAIAYEARSGNWKILEPGKRNQVTLGTQLRAMQVSIDLCKRIMA